MTVVTEVVYLGLYFLYCCLESVFRICFPPRRKNIAGQNVLVTGAGHGIGREIAIELARLGGNLILWDINQSSNEATANIIRAFGGTASAYVCDVSKKDDIKRLAEQVRREVGDVDILVNNAGILNGDELLEIDDDDIQKTFDINTMAHFWTIKEFLPSMISKNKGHLVCVASMAGRFGVCYLVDYCASKFAVYGMMEALSEELRCTGKDGVKTTLVCPTVVDTGIIKIPKDRFNVGMLTAKDTADAAIDGVLRNKQVVIIPRVAELSICMSLLPRKFVSKLRDFAGIGLFPQYHSNVNVNRNPR
ncbi:hypothetical protein ACJMK2_002063 [Sinanodonta woodiana]|uniref:Short-chain dehydrogenase/reductase 3 n=1 Tax=Sinanodonta woodiana TaxID=1069815 RepID=A0ABD3XU42_SINWO